MSGIIKASQLSDKVYKITTVSELRSLGDYVGVFSDLFFLSDLNKHFKYDPSDTTSVDDGVDIIVNTATGRVYKSVLDRRTEDEIEVAVSDRLPYASISGLKSSNDSRLTEVYITDKHKTGVFKYDSTDTTTLGDDALVIVDAGGRRYKRQFTGEALATWWGIIPDGNTDQASLWVTALNNPLVRTLRFPYMGATYRIYRVLVPSDKTIIFDAGVIVKGMGTDNDQELLRLNRANNVNIIGYGATLDGFRSAYTTEEQYKGGIGIRSSSNVTIEGLTLKSFNGDGIYIGTITIGERNRDIRVLNCKIDDISRNGISIININNIWIDNCTISNVNGHAPAAAIDIEPNYITEFVQGVRITNLSTKDCTGSGLLFALRTLGNSPNPVDIYVENHVDDGSRFGTQFQIIRAPILGTIKFVGSVMRNPISAGVLLNGYSAKAPRIEMDSPIIYNPFSGNAAYYTAMGAFMVFRNSGEDVEPELGNLHLYNPSIIETRASDIPNYSDYLFRDREGTGNFLITNCSIIDPYSIGTPNKERAILPYSLKEFPLISDKRGVFSKDLGSSDLTISTSIVTGQAPSYFRTIHNFSSTAERNVTLRNECADKTIVTVEIKSANQVNIKTTGGAIINPILNVSTQYLTSSKVGSYVTLEKDNSLSTWRVVSIIGEWYDNIGNEVSFTDRSRVYYLTTTDVTLQEADATVFVENNTRTNTVWLPPVARCKGRRVTVRRSVSYNVTFQLRVRGNGTDLIETDNILQVLAKDESVTLLSDGIIWKIESRSGDDRLAHATNTSYTSRPSAGTLNASYGDRSLGFEVVAPNVNTGSKIYKKLGNTATGNWMEIDGTVIFATT